MLCIAKLIGALSLLAAPIAAQRTWVVAPIAGPGVDFTDIPPAVGAAAPWDRIEVRGSTALAPTYSSFVVDKPLDVEATQGASVYHFRIENLAAGDVVRVAGFRCEPRPTGAAPDQCVMVRNCAGSVLLSSLNVTTRTGDYVDGFVVRDAATVAIQGCIARGRNAGLTSGGAALALERSRVSITFSVLTGGDGGGSASNAAGYDGGSGLTVLGGSVYVATSTLAGGHGGYGWAHSGDGGMGADIAAALSTSVTFATCTLTRGQGVNDGDAVRGSARVAQDCVVTGALSAGAVLVPPIPRLMASPSVAPGGTAVLTIDASAGAIGAIGFDLRQAHAVVSGIAEPLLLSNGLTVAAIGVLSGPQWVWSLPIPNSPLLAQRDLFFQVGASTPAGGLALTPLAATRLL